MKKTTLRKILSLGFLVTVITSSSAQVITSNLDDGSAGTLRNQVTAAASGATLTFATGVTNVTLTAGQITISKSLTIAGNGVSVTTINGNANGRIFDITSGNVTVSGITLTNGVADNGGAVQVMNATFVLSNAAVTNSIANGTTGSGGGIYANTGSIFSSINSTISGNRANRAGGGIESVAGTTVNLNNTNLLSNNAGVSPATAAPGNGGGFHITGNGNAVIVGGTVNLNVAAAEGGGLWNGAGSMSINGTTINANKASGVAADNGGGGIYALNGGTLTIQNAIISNNIADGTAGSGGGILNDVGSTVTITASVINGNTAKRAGGGIEVNSGATSTVTLNNVNLNGNSTLSNPGNGGGLHVTGPGLVNINGGTVNSNTASAEGGGLWNGNGTMNVSGTTINGNTASGAGTDQGGGGIYNLNGGTLIIQNAIISNNIANGTAGSGGGILNDVGSQLSITASSITGNTAVRAGGGIEDNSGTSTILLNNVNLNSNIVTGPPGNGGGLHITGGGSVTITGGTVNNNSATLEGGGLWNGSGIMTVSGTILNANTVSGPAADDGGGAIFNTAGTVNVTNAIITNNLATGAAGSGGGIFSLAGNVTVNGTTLDSNSANRAGGAIEVVAGNLTLNNTVMTGNDVDGGAGTPNPGNGGALHISGITSTVITGGRVTGNDARREGGGLWNQTGSTMTVTNLTVDANTASGPDVLHGGGGIFNNGGDLFVNNSTISNNISDGSLGNGGGVHVKAGTATFLLTTISGNSSANNGGGVYNNTLFSASASTIAGNAATSSGGGISNNSTMTVTLKNSIVAQNTAATGLDLSNATGSFVSNGYNLIGQDNSNIFTMATGDIEGSTATPVNPLLGPLANNGGTTLTRQLLSNSPAFNAGSPTDNFADQIGNIVFGGRRDIGSYESQTTLGNEDFTFSSSKRSLIYPNPATKGMLQIDIAPSFGSAVQGRIYEISSGKLVMKFDANETSNVINLNNIASGIYAVQLSSDNKIETHKLVVGN